MAKISTLIIGTLVASALVALFVSMAADFNDVYTITADNNTSEFEALNKMQELTDLTKNVSDQVDEIGEEQGTLDVIGSYFSSAFQAFKLTKNSFTIIESMTETALEKTMLGDAGTILRDLLISVLLVFVVIGVIVSAILKKDV